MKKLFGFTLSEIMITLGLLGVLAAMTIPTLTYNYRSKLLETQFKTTYTDIQNIGAEINNRFGDMGEYINTYKNKGNDFARDFLYYVTGGFQFGSRENYGPGADQGYTFQKGYTEFYKNIGHTNGARQFGDNRSKHISSLCDNAGWWLDSKGRVWTFNSESSLICVDVNGAAAPNMYNVDIFVFAPMSSEQVARWVYGDTAENANNYTGQFVLCDIDAISRNGASNNWLRDENGDLIRTESGTYKSGGCNQPNQPNRFGEENYNIGKLKECNLNFCPFKNPVTNIAPLKDWDGSDRKNRLGKEVEAGDDYWKDYIQYK